MSMAWELTEDDVDTVLKAHGLVVEPERLSEIHEGIDGDDVEEAALRYNSMGNQSSSALDEIENQLIAQNVIEGEKKFNMADLEEDDDEDDFDDDEFDLEDDDD